ncbi:MAG: nucleotide exchange factor GrpE [Clostridia bacterium]
MKVNLINNSKGWEMMTKKTADAKQQELKKDVMNEEQVSSVEDEGMETHNNADSAVQQAEIEELKKELEQKGTQCDEYLGRLQRAVAEFDNYKKRTAKEKENLYNDAVCDAVSHFLVVLDNMERAVDSCKEGVDASNLLEGIDLVLKQFKDTLSKLGVEVIEAKGQEFNPETHNAVMHVEDDSVGNNIVIEEFQKGYRLKDKVIRHSMVKVAN